MHSWPILSSSSSISSSILQSAESVSNVDSPGIVGAVICVDGETGIVADEAAGHLDGIQSARLQLR